MSRFRFLRSMLVAGAACGLLLGGAMPAVAQQYDPSYDASQPANAGTDQSPGRVARLAYLSGQVQFAPAGENDWGSVDINRPMVIGDRLLTGDNGRAVLELGDASVRIDNGSAFDFLNLTQDNVQIELSQGTLNLAVRQLGNGENFEVDTPTVAFVAATPGVYRIDNSPSGTGSMVTVFQGSGMVYGENGASREVAAGSSYRFNDSSLASVNVNGLPPADDFDRFCETRDSNFTRYTQQQQQYVPSDMIGGDDLYQYGQWNAVPEYGNVWYPTTVPSGWAPYRYGHWAWIDPWGWTWVDNQPWGFAPFHYGRWVYAGNRWGWMPGPVGVRPVYAPALVAFIGGSGLSISLRLGGGGPVGWFPLGPRDVYVPWFHASRNYFTNVNVTNIRNVYVNKTVINNFYNDYNAGRSPRHGRHDYAYRNLPGAVTAVPRNVFADARPVHPAALKLNRDQLARTQLAVRPGVNPGTASLGLRHPSNRPAIRPDREPFARPVVARRQPPARPVEFAAREKLIASQHGQPLTRTQMQDLRKTRQQNTSRDERVKLIPTVAGAAGSAAALDAMRRRGTSTPARPAEPPARVTPTRNGVVQRPAEPARPVEPFKNTVRPIQAPLNPVRNTPARPNELPSARFAHPGEPRSLPRAAEIHPANEPAASSRLPVVRPVERAGQQNADRAAQQRQADNAARQRASEQQMQQRAQEQQRVRTQQADQQRARQQQLQQQRQMQDQQRAREQQAQQRQQTQQRQAEMQQRQQLQEQQRARAQQVQQRQQMQQQRQAEMQQQQAQQRQQMQQQRQAEMQQQQAQQRQMMQQQRQQQNTRAPPEQREQPSRRRHPPESSDQQH